MPDTPATRWTWLMSLTPTIDAIVKAIVWACIGATSLAGAQTYAPGLLPGMLKPAAPVVIAAADVPKPVPVPPPNGAVIEAMAKIDAVKKEVGELRQMIQDRLPPPPQPKAKRAKTVKAQATIASEIRKLDPLAK